MTMSSFSELVCGVTTELATCASAVSPSSVEGAVDEITKSKRVFVGGAGRSGLAIRAGAVRLMHLGKTAHVVGEVTTPPITDEDLLLVGSGSGRTETLLATAQKAKKEGARLLVITIDPESPLAQLADRIVEVPAPAPKVVSSRAPAKSIQPLGNLFEQTLLILLDVIVTMMMERQGLSSDEMFTRHANLE